MISMSVLSFILILVGTLSLGGFFGIMIMALIVGGNSNGRD